MAMVSKEEILNKTMAMVSKEEILNLMIGRNYTEKIKK
jgi:hypothetical protein